MLESLFGFAVAGVVVSLALEYFPKLNSWYNAQPDNTQKMLILASGLVVVLGAFGLSCVEFLVELPVACSFAGLKELVAAYITYVLTTQGTYLVTPKSS